MTDALPTRPAEWDAVVAVLGDKFDVRFRAMHGESFDDAIDPRQHGAKEIRTARGDAYDIAARILTGGGEKAGAIAIADSNGEVRVLAARKIGIGASAVVWRAARPTDGFGTGTSDIAIKIREAGARMNDPVLDGPVTEVAAPWMKTMAGRGTEQPRDAVVMDACDDPVAEVIGQPWNPHDAARMVVQVDRGLAKARIGGAAFVHRDIKPENLFMVFDRNPDGTHTTNFRVGDLGLACRKGQMVPQYGGTWAYVSPNQHDASDTPKMGIGAVEATDKWDAFSLAATTYECLTGKNFRDNIAVKDAQGHPYGEENCAQVRTESGFRSIPKLPDWELVLHGSLLTDQDRQAGMALFAARTQQFLSRADRQSLTQEDLHRYADAFISRETKAQDAIFARVDAQAITALIRDPRVDNETRRALVSKRSELVAVPDRAMDGYLERCEFHDRAARQHAIAETRVALARSGNTAQYETNRGPPTKSLREWEQQRARETAGRGPPTKGPTR